MNKLLKDFFDMKEKIIQNAILMNLYIAKYHPNIPIYIGQTNRPLDLDTFEILEKIPDFKMPKSYNYDLFVMFVPYNKFTVGIQYNNHEIIWKSEHSCEKELEDIANDIYSTYPIIAKTVHSIFMENYTPTDFITYLKMEALITYWRYGFKRTTETARKTSLTVNFKNIETYRNSLENALKKYKMIVKVHERLSHVGYFTCSNSWESFTLRLLDPNNCVFIQYCNFEENTKYTNEIDISELTPKRLDKIKIPLIRLMLM